MPQRMSSKTPEKKHPMPQRCNGASSPSTLIPQAQRMASKSSKKQLPMPQRVTTPEMPRLHFSPAIARKGRSPSLPSRLFKDQPIQLPSNSTSTSPVAARRTRLPRSPLKPSRNEPVQLHPDSTSASIIVNGEVYTVLSRIGKGGSSEVFQVPIYFSIPNIRFHNFQCFR